MNNNIYDVEINALKSLISDYDFKNWYNLVTIQVQLADYKRILSIVNKI